MSVKAINLRTRYVGREATLIDQFGDVVWSGTVVRSNVPSKHLSDWERERFVRYNLDTSAGKVGIFKDDALVLKPKPKPRKVKATELTDSDVGKMIRVQTGKILAVSSPYEGMLTHRNGNGNKKDALWPFVDYSVNRTSLVVTDTITFL